MSMSSRVLLPPTLRILIAPIPIFVFTTSAGLLVDYSLQGAFGLAVWECGDVEIVVCEFNQPRRDDELNGSQGIAENRTIQAGRLKLYGCMGVWSTQTH